MDIGSGVVRKAWVPEFSPETPFSALSSSGQLALATVDDETGTALKILDAVTGKERRAFKGFPGRIRDFLWLHDAKWLFFLTADRIQASILNAETGETLFSLVRDGHYFLSQAPYEDASGNAWIFSKDKANNRYVWPLTPDGAPRKVMDGDRLAPGHIHLCVSDPSYLLATDRSEDQKSTMTAYALDDLHKIACWYYGNSEFGWFDEKINRVMTHLLVSCPVEREDQYKPENMAFSVYAAENETPVRQGRGKAVAISPNAKYLVIQTGNAAARLYSMDTDEAVCKYGISNPNGYFVYMTAAFSDDGKRLVVNTGKTLEVTDLIDGYPQRTLTAGEDKYYGWKEPRFSPDGTLLLCGSNGCAWLFNTDTGALLHTFTETERFAEPYAYQNGFWSSLAVTAKDWAGMVSDKFKPGGFVEVAFADGGAQVVTHAVGQIIRVWDTESGKLLRTIRTRLPEKRNAQNYIINQIVITADGRFAYCYNQNGFGTATLWSLDDGTLQLQYRIPGSLWVQAVPSDDGSAVYIVSNVNLYRWPGAPMP